MAKFYASFGSSKTGIATVGYEQVDGVTSVVARATAGVVEVGGGVYMVPVVLNVATTGILWDTGEGTPVYAFEDFNMNRLRQILINRRETNPSTGVQTIYEDDGTTAMLTGNLFEDVAGSQAYQGSGIDRANALT